MPFAEHLLFAPEPSWGTYTTPTMAIPVRSSSFAPMRPLNYLAETGAGRARRMGVLGEKPVKGGLEVNFTPLFMPFFLRSVCGARTVTKLPAPPTLNTAVGAITGGTLATGAYKYKLTAVDPTGISGPSAELTGTVASGSTGSVVLGWTPSTTAGVTTVNVYRTAVGGAAGSELLLTTVAVGTATYTDTGGLTPAAPAVPTLQAYQADMVPDDTLDYGSFSVQQLHTGSIAQAFRGVRMDGFNLSLQAKQSAIGKMSFLAQDSCLVGGNWADGTTGPASQAVATYAPATVEPFKFFQATMNVGGTPTLAANAFSIAGGAAFVGIENVEVDFKFDHDADGFTVNGGLPTIQYLVAALRSITVKVTADFSTVGTAYYTAWQAGANTSLVIDLKSNLGSQGGFAATTIGSSGRPYEAKLTLPFLRYQEAPLPDISGTIARRKSTISFEAYADPVSAKDFGWTILSTDDLT